jgi:peroxiredoxin
MKKIVLASLLFIFSIAILGVQKTMALAITEDVVAESSTYFLDKGQSNKAPDFKLKSTDGKDVRLSDYKGKIIVIDFWATWCAPCRKGIPDLIDIQKKYKEKVVVIGISLDTQTQSDVIPFIKKFGINYPIAYGNAEVVQAYGNIQAIPTSFIVDQKGNIVDTHVGLVDKSVYLNKIEQLLKKS